MGQQRLGEIQQQYRPSPRSTNGSAEVLKNDVTCAARPTTHEAVYDRLLCVCGRHCLLEDAGSLWFMLIPPYFYTLWGEEAGGLCPSPLTKRASTSMLSPSDVRLSWGACALPRHILFRQQRVLCCLLATPHSGKVFFHSIFEPQPPAEALFI